MSCYFGFSADIPSRQLHNILVFMEVNCSALLAIWHVPTQQATVEAFFTLSCGKRMQKHVQRTAADC